VISPTLGRDPNLAIMEPGSAIARALLRRFADRFFLDDSTKAVSLVALARMLQVEAQGFAVS